LGSRDRRESERPAEGKQEKSPHESDLTIAPVREPAMMGL
jgi:hypothetical protein